MTTSTEQPPPAESTVRSSIAAPARAERVRGALSFRNIGAAYIWVIIIVVFSVSVPDTFPTMATVRQVLNGNAVTALMALALIVPLCARVFDLSIAYTASLSAVTAAYCIQHDWAVVPAIMAALGVALLVGVINGTVVVLMRVDSFIGTLATGSLIQAFNTLITKDIAITDPRLSGSFSHIAQKDIRGVTLPVFYALAVAIAIWFLLEHTATGRRLYAAGFNLESARLANVRTQRLQFGSLIASALVAGVAGIVLASTIGSGDPTSGSPYLLPAFAAVFLGATQLRGGRFNAFGTLIAVLMIGTGVTGLGLASAPTWAPSMFTGVVLIAALAVTEQERRVMRGGRWMSRLRRTPGVPPTSLSTQSPGGETP